MPRAGARHREVHEHLRATHVRVRRAQAPDASGAVGLVDLPIGHQEGSRGLEREGAGRMDAVPDSGHQSRAGAKAQRSAAQQRSAVTAQAAAPAAAAGP